MNNLVFFLEEPSAKEMLKGLLPKLLPKNMHSAVYIVFQGKRDLEKKLYDRLSGWRTPNSIFIVLLDQDSEDCKLVKNRLINQCERLKKSKKIIFRIACYELESWYFGDLSAVEKALNHLQLTRYASKAKYRDPDKINKPCEELKKITRGEYQKISGSRAIGPHLSLNKNTSKSFNIFIKGIRKLIGESRTNS